MLSSRPSKLEAMLNGHDRSNVSKNGNFFFFWDNIAKQERDFISNLDMRPSRIERKYLLAPFKYKSPIINKEKMNWNVIE